MSEFNLPHVEDLDTNSYLIRQLIEDFKAIEQEFNDLRGEIDKMKKQDQDNRNFFDDIYHQNEKKDKEG